MLIISCSPFSSWHCKLTHNERSLLHRHFSKCAGFGYNQPKFLLFVWLCEVESKVFTQQTFLNICRESGKGQFESSLMFSQGRPDLSHFGQALYISLRNRADRKHFGRCSNILLLRTIFLIFYMLYLKLYIKKRKHIIFLNWFLLLGLISITDEIF